MLNVFAGYDPRVPEGFETFRHSVERHASHRVVVIPLDQTKLRKGGLYWRPRDEQSSTPFSLTRFLIPALCGFRGFAAFVDGSDMLSTSDIAHLFDFAQGSMDQPRVWCVPHSYTPNAGPKFFGAAQHIYPRKNWSSVMVFNCARCTSLTVRAVNENSPAWLHQMQWVNSDEIGELSAEWNWLAGEPGFHWTAEHPPGLIHYTLGLPSVPEAVPTEFDGLWYAERDLLREKIHAPTPDSAKA